MSVFNHYLNSKRLPSDAYTYASTTSISYAKALHSYPKKISKS
uniref:Uncharacterized protein n=1 Tax=Anguilla anguilla TaxID=7936 RepID=A0A0E9XSF9_ANGAN